MDCVQPHFSLKKMKMRMRMIVLQAVVMLETIMLEASSQSVDLKREGE